MIIVRVELHSANTGNVTELARMEICNDGTGTALRRNYLARVLRGRSTAQLDRRDVQRTAELRGWQSERWHIWNLVATLLQKAGYGTVAMS